MGQNEVDPGGGGGNVSPMAVSNEDEDDHPEAGPAPAPIASNGGPAASAVLPAENGNLQGAAKFSDLYAAFTQCFPGWLGVQLILLNFHLPRQNFLRFINILNRKVQGDPSGPGLYLLLT